MINLKTKHIIIIVFTTIFSILLSGSIDYENSNYSNMDMHKYISMAEASPDIETDVIRPFVYRIGAPWIAGILPFSISTNFLILNSISLLLLSLVFYFFLIEYGTEEKLALVFTIIFQLNRYLFQFAGWNYFQLSDTLSLTFLFYAFILLRQRNFIKLFIIMVLGILIKEYLLMIIPAGFILLIENKYKKKDIILFSLISFFSLLTFWGIRKLIPTEVGESLFLQYTSQVVFYSKPFLLVKRFILPFSPFGLLPLIFYKDLYKFFREYKHLFIFSITVIILSFFGESERLMAPLYSVYFLFIAQLVSKYFSFDSKSIISLIIISFFTSFYHLWGIITLPNKYYSLISAAVFSLVVAVMFLINKTKLKNVKID